MAEPGDVVMGTHTRSGESFIGRVMSKGPQGMMRVVLDNGRELFAFAQADLVVVEQYTGDAIVNVQGWRTIRTESP